MIENQSIDFEAEKKDWGQPIAKQAYSRNTYFKDFSFDIEAGRDDIRLKDRFRSSNLIRFSMPFTNRMLEPT